MENSIVVSGLKGLGNTVLKKNQAELYQLQHSDKNKIEKEIIKKGLRQLISLKENP